MTDRQIGWFFLIAAILLAVGMAVVPLSMSGRL